MKRRYMVVIALMIIIVPHVALADFGPKPLLEITVDNAPRDTYYLDLLVTDKDGMEAKYDPANYDEELYRMLWEYNENGYRAAIVHQSELWGIRGGSLTGHKYIQAPSVFKIIIVTKKGIQVSETYIKLRFSEVIRIDYETMKITCASASVFSDWLLQFARTFSATILIEGIILLIFGFRLKDNWKPFLLVNLITQVFLIVSMGVVMVMWGVIAYLLLFGIVEAIILVVESCIYRKLLRREKPGGRVAYAITANLLSLLASFVLILLSAPI